MRYLLKPVKFRSVPSPKSSRVHCNTPLLFTTRHGRVTCSPTMAIWSKGSLRNAWPTSVTLVAPWQNESMLDENRIGKMKFLDFTTAIFLLFFSVTDIISYSGGDISWYGHLVLKEKEIDMKNMGLMHTVRDKDITKENSNWTKIKNDPWTFNEKCTFFRKTFDVGTSVVFFYSKYLFQGGVKLLDDCAMLLVIRVVKNAIFHLQYY